MRIDTRHILITAAYLLLQSVTLYGQGGWQWRIGGITLIPGNPPALQAEILLVHTDGAATDTLQLGHHTLGVRFSEDLYNFGQGHDPETGECGLDSFSVSLTNGPEPYDLQWNAVCNDNAGMVIPAGEYHIFSLKLSIKNIHGVSDLFFTPMQQTFARNGTRITIGYDDSGGSVALDTTNMAVDTGMQPPGVYALLPNYPNPFNPGTSITFEIPRPGYTELAVYNVQGKKVKTLYTGSRKPGTYTLYWDGTDETGRPAAAGVLLLHLQSGRYRACRKMLLLK